MKKKLLKVFSILLSGLMVFNMFVVPTPVNAQDVGTYAYEDVTKNCKVSFVMGDVTVTAYTRYNSTTQKYTLLRFTYSDAFKATYPLAKVKSVTCTTCTPGSVITQDLLFDVTATNGVGTTWTFTGRIRMN